MRTSEVSRRNRSPSPWGSRKDQGPDSLSGTHVPDRGPCAEGGSPSKKSPNVQPVKRGCLHSRLPHKGHCIPGSNAAKSASLHDSFAQGRVRHGKVNKVETAAPKLYWVLIKSHLPNSRKAYIKDLNLPPRPCFYLDLAVLTNGNLLSSSHTRPQAWGSAAPMGLPLVVPQGEKLPRKEIDRALFLSQLKSLSNTLIATITLVQGISWRSYNQLGLMNSPYH